MRGTQVLGQGTQVSGQGTQEPGYSMLPSTVEEVMNRLLLTKKVFQD